MFKFKTYCPLTTATTERHHKQWMLKATGENHLQSLKIFMCFENLFTAVK